MNELKLVLPDESHKEQYLEMMDEWISFGGRLNPSALKNNGASYEKWLGWMKDDQSESTCPEGAVPQTLYFAFNEANVLLGAVTIRHFLNERMFIDGGYVGYGVRPSQRRKCYAKRMLALAISKINEMGVNKILITCAIDNIGSIKTILANGGIFENEVLNEYGALVKRFWVYCEYK
jgi:predicted acetyltransferase